MLDKHNLRIEQKILDNDVIIYVIANNSLLSTIVYSKQKIISLARYRMINHEYYLILNSLYQYDYGVKCENLSALDITHYIAYDGFLIKNESDGKYIVSNDILREECQTNHIIVDDIIMSVAPDKQSLRIIRNNIIYYAEFKASVSNKMSDDDNIASIALAVNSLHNHLILGKDAAYIYIAKRLYDAYKADVLLEELS